MPAILLDILYLVYSNVVSAKISLCMLRLLELSTTKHLVACICLCYDWYNCKANVFMHSIITKCLLITLFICLKVSLNCSYKINIFNAKLRINIIFWWHCIFELRYESTLSYEYKLWCGLLYRLNYKIFFCSKKSNIN